MTVCGVVDPSVELGSLVCFDDLHFLANRLGDGELCTFYSAPGDRRRGHWIFEGPFSEALRQALLDGGREAGVTIRDGGVYGHVDGPRFNTRAEIRGLAACGVTHVSQTGGPEAVLCGEAELPYALLGYATDYANGVQDEATPVQTLLDMMAASTGDVRRGARRGGAARGGRRAAAGGHRLPLRGLTLADHPHARLRAAGDDEVVVLERAALVAARLQRDAVPAPERLDAVDQVGEVGGAVRRALLVELVAEQQLEQGLVRRGLLEAASLSVRRPA